MIRSATRLFLLWTLAGSLALLAGACSDSATKSTPAVEPLPQDSAGQQQSRQAQQAQQVQLAARLAAIQEHAARLDSQFAQLRADQQKRLQDLAAESQSLAAEIANLRRQFAAPGAPTPVTQPAPAATPASTPRSVTPESVPPPSVQGKSPFFGPLMRFVLLIILIVAIWIIVRIFMGRWGEEDEEDEEFTSGSLDEEITTDEGIITFAPEAQVPPAGSPEGPGRPRPTTGPGEGSEPKP